MARPSLAQRPQVHDPPTTKRSSTGRRARATAILMTGRATRPDIGRRPALGAMAPAELSVARTACSTLAACAIDNRPFSIYAIPCRDGSVKGVTVMASRGSPPLTYFTGRPCRRGHIAERYAASRRCVECARENAQTPEQKKRVADIGRTPHGHNTSAKYRNSPKGRTTARNGQARRKGITAPPPEWECPPRPENGKCQCCGRIAPSHKGKPPGRESLVLEHDHHTGAFRGWTCSNCNAGLGFFGDSMVGIRRAVQYMATHYLTGRHHGK